MYACLSVWVHLLGDRSVAGDALRDPPGAVPVQPSPVGGEEDGSFTALAASDTRNPFSASRETQGMPGRRAEPGGDQQHTELVAVQPGSVRLVIQAGPANMGDRE